MAYYFKQRTEINMTPSLYCNVKEQLLSGNWIYWAPDYTSQATITQTNVLSHIAFNHQLPLF
jgi:hypothetical protein